MTSSGRRRSGAGVEGHPEWFTLAYRLGSAAARTLWVCWHT